MLSFDTTLQNRWHILKPLGAGGMGAVYLARDLKFDKVAVKGTLPGSDSEYCKAFASGPGLLNRLHHGSLSHGTNYFSEGEGQFLVMQFIEGNDLGDLLHNRLTSGPEPFPHETVEALLNAAVKAKTVFANQRINEKP
jgi:eukaryotic-like serine/threonine-protein kinase